MSPFLVLREQGKKGDSRKGEREEGREKVGGRKEEREGNRRAGEMKRTEKIGSQRERAEIHTEEQNRKRGRRGQRQRPLQRDLPCLPLQYLPHFAVGCCEHPVFIHQHCSTVKLVTFEQSHLPRVRAFFTWVAIYNSFSF